MDLNSIYYTSNITSDPTKQESTINFISIIEGNLGATLTDSWFNDGENGEENNDEGTDKVRYSEYPFSAGLATIEERKAHEGLEVGGKELIIRYVLYLLANQL